MSLSYFEGGCPSVDRAHSVSLWLPNPLQFHTSFGSKGCGQRRYTKQFFSVQGVTEDRCSHAAAAVAAVTVAQFWNIL